MDQLASLRIFARIDEVARLLAEEMQLSMPTAAAMREEGALPARREGILCAAGECAIPPIWPLDSLHLVSMHPYQ